VRRPVYLVTARRDLMATQRYIARESGSRAVPLCFVAMLREQCEKLAALPGTLGRPRPELRPDLRSFPFKSNVIFFRYHASDFEVVSILESHRDAVCYLQEGEDQPPDPIT
jgi:plasmid stabilization system protein ParE